MKREPTSTLQQEVISMVRRWTLRGQFTMSDWESMARSISAGRRRAPLRKARVTAPFTSRQRRWMKSKTV